jgi:dolichol-phosphate mannosyltransferase
MNKDTLVICPVYNEARSIAEFWESLRLHYRDDVLFVNDGSTDESRDFLCRLKPARTFTIHHPRRRGYGAALISGFRFALDKGYKRIVTIDADLQHPPTHIRDFFNQLQEWEVILGSRYIKISKTLDIPHTRLVINRYIAGLISVLFYAELTDPFCGFRGYRDSFLRKANFKETSYGIGLEILLEIIRTKTAFKEIPVEAIYFKDSRRFLDGLDDPSKRLRYYLEVISRKRNEVCFEEKVSLCKPAP